MRTTITVTGLQLYGYHGMFDAERQLGQKFVFDVRAQLAPAGTHLADQLDASVRYDNLVQDVVGISGDSKFHTLEALAETMARRLLQRYAVIQHITISVAKLSPPMPHMVEQARIEVSLEAEELHRGQTQAHRLALPL